MPSQNWSAGNGVPSEGVAFLSTNDLDKKNLKEIAKELLNLDLN